MGVTSLDGGEVTSKNSGAVLAVESVRWPTLAYARPHLVEMAGKVVDADEPSARLEDARELTQTTIEILEVIENPIAHDHIEAPVVEFQPFDVCADGTESTADGRINRHRGLIDTDHFRSRNERSYLAVAAPGVENPTRPHLCDRPEQGLERLTRIT